MPKNQLSSEMLQIHFEQEATVRSVALQGHPNNDYWVTQFALDFSDDGNAWRIHPQVKLTGVGRVSEPVAQTAGRFPFFLPHG